jgi:hypothetical protein
VSLGVDRYKPQEAPLEKKRKEFKKANREEPKAVKMFQDYNFMPLNTRVSDLLMEIKKTQSFVDLQRYQVILIQ